MKKGYLKVLAAVVAAVMLMSMGLSAFAATYTTTTTYNTSDESKVDVVTEVTGVGDEDQVAYLVTENVSGNNNIIWIDQQPADDGEVTFNFTTDAANALGLGSTVKVGSTTYAANGFEAAQTEVKLASFDVTVVSAGNGKVEVDAAATTNYVTFTVYPDAGYEFDKCVIVDGEDETEVAWVVGSNAKKVKVTADSDYKIYFKKIAEAEVAEVPAKVGASAVAEVEGVKVGSVAGKAVGAADFGILVANEANADLLVNITAAEVAALDETAESGVRKYKALGATEAGDYVINLKDDNGVFFTEGAVYKAVMYALNGSSLKLSDVFTWGE